YIGALCKHRPGSEASRRAAPTFRGGSATIEYGEKMTSSMRFDHALVTTLALALPLALAGCTGTTDAAPATAPTPSVSESAPPTPTTTATPQPTAAAPVAAPVLED